MLDSANYWGNYFGASAPFMAKKSRLLLASYELRSDVLGNNGVVYLDR